MSGTETFTARQLAARFNVTSKTVTRWCRENLFPHARQAGNQSEWFIPASDLEGFAPPFVGRAGLSAATAPRPGSLTALEVAARYGVTRETARRWCEVGLFPGAYKVANVRRHPRWMIPETDLEGFTPPNVLRQMTKGERMLRGLEVAQVRSFAHAEGEDELNRLLDLANAQDGGSP